MKSGTDESGRYGKSVLIRWEDPVAKCPGFLDASEKGRRKKKCVGVGGGGGTRQKKKGGGGDTKNTPTETDHLALNYQKGESGRFLPRHSAPPAVTPRLRLTCQYQCVPPIPRLLPVPPLRHLAACFVWFTLRALGLLSPRPLVWKASEWSALFVLPGSGCLVPSPWSQVLSVIHYLCQFF